MVKANELRIGNLVEYTFIGIRQIESGADIDHVFEAGRMPILLTEEWLERVGFEKRHKYWEPFVGDARGAWFDRGEIVVMILKNGKGIYRAIPTNGDEFGYIDGPEIKYSHQLQNLYFALTGEELTIKP